mmetsp:Transcript_10908/g.21114  ORF Transcript_10908/g.21114 Transcript_10908/m.21114 type:complete len:125 (-) Transcript_10908:2084-2458(-)
MESSGEIREAKTQTETDREGEKEENNPHLNARKDVTPRQPVIYSQMHSSPPTRVCGGHRCTIIMMHTHVCTCTHKHSIHKAPHPPSTHSRQADHGPRPPPHPRPSYSSFSASTCLPASHADLCM